MLIERARLEGLPPGSSLRIARIGRLGAIRSRHPDLLRRLFTPAEWNYCTERRLGDQHLAVRLAAKRAARDLGVRAAFSRIEITRNDQGAPALLIDGQACALRVSLSHDGDLAIALVAGESP